jgi:predicted acyltransferase (DUF342 family)
MKTSTKNSMTVVSQWTRFLGAMLMVALMVPRAFAAGPAGVNLATAGELVILSQAGISNTGITHIWGDIGVSSPAVAADITGFGLVFNTTYSTSSLITGNVYASDYTDPTQTKMSTANTDMLAAYGDAAGRTSPDQTDLGSGNIGGMTFTPGLYKWNSGVTIPTNVTFNGSSTDVWIFQIAGTLDISDGKQVILHGALPSNIFWQVTGQVTIGTSATMKGIILCQTAIVFSNSATLDGKVMAQGSVTLNTNTVNAIPEPVNLGAAAKFAVLAGSKVSDVPTSAVTGDVGLYPAAGSYITGFGLTEVTGTIYASDATYPTANVAVIDAAGLLAAKGDLTIAYNDAAGRTPVPTGTFLNPNNGSADIGGQTLVAGLYKFTSSALISTNVHLSGSATDVWIFQITSNLNVSDYVQVILDGDAKASNIFWQVGSSAALGTYTVFKGTIMADQSITLGTGATVEGRLLASSAAVTLDMNTVTRPAPIVYANPATINLLTLTTNNFRILAGTAVTIASGCTVPGDVGVSPTAGATVSNSGIVTGTIHENDGAAIQAQSDLSSVIATAAGRTPDPTVGTELGGTTLGRGVYVSTAGATFDITGDLILSGNASDIFIFQMTTTLTTAANSQVLLTGGVLGSNVFWQVGSDATLGANSVFKGSIMANHSISVGSGVAMDGRALAQNGMVILGSNTALPVELVSFTATATGLNADLHWSTATEINNSGFEIQRRQTSDWAKVGFVAGAGTSNSPRNYSYIDSKLSAGSYAYRLKQIDNNGAFKYGTTVEVAISSAPAAFALAQNYPNPFNPSTVISYSLEKAGMVSLRVYNLLGQEVATLVNGPQEAGVYSVPFNTSKALGLSSGVYVYRLEAGSFVSTKKLVLMK